QVARHKLIYQKSRSHLQAPLTPPPITKRNGVDADVGPGRGVHRVLRRHVSDLEQLPWIDPTHPP
ncbi:hypothetical protein, partial [Dactylosporangium sp. NPDC051484]|uniref:hypothetical protein n=1 Tax=Dactylosporangium sp. NPDC051484 TaxID=3154942 RepID=UPI003450DC8E